MVGIAPARSSRFGNWLAAGGAAALGLALLVAAAIAWIVVDVSPRFRSPPLRLPLQHTVWDPYDNPRDRSIALGAPVELGMLFRPGVAGTIVGVRFYRVSGDNGPHIGTLWTPKGKQLASVTFTGETPSSWQEAHFATPVPVNAGRLLIASYFAPVGGQLFLEPPRQESDAAATSATPAFQRPPVNGGPASLYHLGGPGFPTTDAGTRAAWVDVVFVPEGADR